MMPMMTPPSDTSTVTTNPYGDYSPGDTGDWQDIGPWFASVIFAVVLVPFAWRTLTGAIARVFRHV